MVDIRYRKNATWQGEVLWVDQNRQCSFRSALELLKLIDSALETRDMQEPGGFGIRQIKEKEKGYE